MYYYNTMWSVCQQRDTNFPTEQVQWADGCLIVYSITDKKSFNYAMDTLDNLQKVRPNNSLPITLLANKADLEHLREVGDSALNDY